MTMLGEIFDTLDWLEETQPEDFDQRRSNCCVIGMHARRVGYDGKRRRPFVFDFLISAELPYVAACFLYSSSLVPDSAAQDVSFCVEVWRKELRRAAPAAYWAHEFKKAVKRGIPRPFVAKHAVAQPVLGGAIA